MDKLHALIWDVDGTLAETERDGHRVAFNRAFEYFDLPWRWSVHRYGELLRISGGRERLLYDLARQPQGPTGDAARARLASQLHQVKNAFYAEIVASGRIELRPGVADLIDECEAGGLPLAIATTTSRANVDALIGAAFGDGWASRWACVVCAEDAPVKKPDPQVYALALQRLGLPASAVLAIEDSSPGLAAGLAAGVPVVVTRSVYFADVDGEGAVAIGPGLHRRSGWTTPDGEPMTVGQPTSDQRVDLELLRRWFAARPQRTAAFTRP